MSPPSAWCWGAGREQRGGGPHPSHPPFSIILARRSLGSASCPPCSARPLAAEHPRDPVPHEWWPQVLLQGLAPLGELWVTDKGGGGINSPFLTPGETGTVGWRRRRESNRSIPQLPPCFGSMQAASSSRSNTGISLVNYIWGIIKSIQLAWLMELQGPHPSHGCWHVVGPGGRDASFACSHSVFGAPPHQEGSKLDLTLLFELFPVLNYTRVSLGKDFSFSTRGVALGQVN